MRKTTFFKSLLLALALVTGSVSAWGAVSITPVHTGTIASFSTWSHTSCTTASASSNDYIKMVNAASKVVTPTLNFTGYSKITLDFKAGTFGTVNDVKKTITVSISINNGDTWTSVGVRLPSSSTIASISQFDLSTYIGNQALIKFETLGADGSNGVRLDEISINGELPTSNVSTPSITISGVMRSVDNYFVTASVGLSTTTEGASIYYTTNGDAPTASSTAYTAPFDITTTTTVKAIAVKDGLDNSAVAEKTITISTPATATIPYTEAFNNTLGDWINFEVAGTKPWVASVNGALGNGYGGGDVESWLISPKFTAAGDGIALSFDYASKYVGNPITVKMSSNYMGYGNPSAATWTDLSTIAAPTVQDNDYTLKSTGSIIASGTGTVYFALVYDVAAAPYSD